MSTASARPSRVLLGNLEPIALIGMRRMLASDGIDVVGEEATPADIVLAVERLEPDAVVLALDHGASRALGERVREVAPRAKVIFWARNERVMEILDPGAVAPRRLRRAAPEGLCSELATPQAIGPEE